jgi:predicted outer membrane repeat protein
MRRVAIISSIILTLAVGSAWARTWNVYPGGTGDAPTIQAAIDSSAAGDTVLAGPGTYEGVGNRDIDFAGKAIVVMSSSGAAVTIIDCAGSEAEPHRGFYFHSGEDTTSVLRGFTITNGSVADRGGAIRCIGASPRIVDDVVTANFARGGGGGIYCEGTHSIISGNTISNNQVTIFFAARSGEPEAPPLHARRGSATSLGGPSGGNISCVSDSSRIEHNTITGGKGTNGSAVFCDASSVRAADNDIFQNGGSYTQGTVCFLSGSYDIEGNIVTDNTSHYSGAGLYCSGGTYRIAGNTISFNRFFADFGGRGGGMFCETGDFTIEDNDIDSNENKAGGGIWIGGSGTIRDNRITGNSAYHVGPCANCLLGAALYAPSIDVGGGILISGSTSLLVTGNTITKNSAPWGGGIACFGGSPEIIENIIVSNGAHHNPCGGYGSEDGKGAGLYVADASPLVIGNTIWGNSAGNAESSSCYGGAGIHCGGGGAPTIQRNIIGKNKTDNALIVGGIYCESASCTPSISCCDFYGNANGDYGGTLADQTGLNGNFSEDPDFCGEDYGDFQIHVFSPCAPGHHPSGEDCDLIGALGPACNYMATLLQGYSTSLDPAAVTITWTLSEAADDLRCSVLRAEGSDGEYRGLDGSGIARDGLTFTCRDASFDPGTAYRYRVDVVDEDGSRTLFETGEIATPALPLSLDQNVPNPFNPSTAISYYLPRDSKVTLVVYDVTGRVVASLRQGTEAKGRHRVVWDGKDARGSSVGSGIYFYRLTAGKESISKKMILLR